MRVIFKLVILRKTSKLTSPTFAHSNPPPLPYKRGSPPNPNPTHNKLVSSYLGYTVDNTWHKKGEIAQMVEQAPSNRKHLSSNPC